MDKEILIEYLINYGNLTWELSHKEVMYVMKAIDDAYESLQEGTDE